jgi:hypothetical protein
MGKQTGKINKPELAWTKADYLMAKREIPDKLLDDDVHTEGELMSEEEITSWLVDTEKTFPIIKKQNEKLFENLYQRYVVDIHYLCELGKITEEDADELLRPERFNL